MSLKTDTKSRFVGYLDALTGLCLKLASPVLIAAVLFLAVGALSGKLQGVLKMPAADREQMISVIELAAQAVLYCGSAVVACVVVRFFSEEVVGQSLTVGGVLLYFGSPWFFVSLAGLDRMGGTTLPTTIVEAFRTVGAVALLPGLVLLLRDAILRVWIGVSTRRTIERRATADGREEECVSAGLLAQYYPKCWEMGFCRELVRRVCPAYEKKKSCWKLGLGCYCDEKTILRAHRQAQPGAAQAQTIPDASAPVSADSERLVRSLRKSRCKSCAIYSEHQVQKYKILSPMVFPTVLAVLWVFHDRIAETLRTGILTADRFMSVLAYKTGVSTPAVDETARLMIGIAFVWLAIVMISYALRILEYLIFDLQV